MQAVYYRASDGSEPVDALARWVDGFRARLVTRRGQDLRDSYKRGAHPVRRVSVPCQWRGERCDRQGSRREFASRPGRYGLSRQSHASPRARYPPRMTLLRPRVDERLPVPAIAPRPPLVHVPA